jgi:hypothetical protein
LVSTTAPDASRMATWSCSDASTAPRSPSAWRRRARCTSRAAISAACAAHRSATPRMCHRYASHTEGSRFSTTVPAGRRSSGTPHRRSCRQSAMGTSGTFTVGMSSTRAPFRMRMATRPVSSATACWLPTTPPSAPAPTWLATST